MARLAAVCVLAAVACLLNSMAFVPAPESRARAMDTGAVAAAAGVMAVRRKPSSSRVALPAIKEKLTSHEPTSRLNFWTIQPPHTAEPNIAITGELRA